MKKLLLALVVTFSVVGYAVAEISEYRVSRVQADFINPSTGNPMRGDTVIGSLSIIRSQAFVSDSSLWVKLELCLTPYFPGCREVFEKYRFKSFDGTYLQVVDSFNRPGRIKVLRMEPLRAILPGNVTIDLREVAFSGKDRNRDITAIQSIREAVEDVESNDEGFGDIFPAF